MNENNAHMCTYNILPQLINVAHGGNMLLTEVLCWFNITFFFLQLVVWENA
jgi:hypothetical protein